MIWQNGSKDSIFAALFQGALYKEETAFKKLRLRIKNFEKDLVVKESYLSLQPVSKKGQVLKKSQPERLVRGVKFSK